MRSLISRDRRYSVSAGVVVLPVLGQGAELEVADGHARLVAAPLVDFQGPAVQRLGGVVVPPQLSQDAEHMLGLNPPHFRGQ